MVQPDSQWLYVITDSLVRNSTNITTFVDLLTEGSNVAFVYNATDNDAFCNVIYFIVPSFNRLNNKRSLDFRRYFFQFSVVCFLPLLCIKREEIIFQVTLMCHVQELVSALSNALKLSLMIEMELYNRVSEEEFQLIRLNKRERRREILKNIKVCSRVFSIVFKASFIQSKFLHL